MTLSCTAEHAMSPLLAYTLNHPRCYHSEPRTEMAQGRKYKAWIEVPQLIRQKCVYWHSLNVDAWST